MLISRRQALVGVAAAGALMRPGIVRAAPGLLLPPRGLEFPQGLTPGFDPMHPAANFSLAGISMAAPVAASAGANTTVRNLVNGAAFTRYGNAGYYPTPFGPSRYYAAGANLDYFANGFSTTPAKFTFAGIITPISSVATGTLLTSNQIVQTNGVSLQLNSLSLAYCNGATIASGLPALSLNVPYFVGAAWVGGSAPTLWFCQTNLMTGQFWSANASGSPSSAATGACWAVGGTSTASSSCACRVHAAMMGIEGLLPALFQQWAQRDPWGFWYQ